VFTRLEHPRWGCRVTQFAVQLEDHIGSLRRYARALLRDRVEADDLVQDSLARALSRSHCYRPGTNLRAWLFTVMHNVHVNRLRRRTTRPDEVAVDDVESQLTTPPGQHDHIELQELGRVVRLLPEEQRQVLLLVALEGLKYEEVAQVLEVPVGTVMSRLSRARETLRTRLSANDRRPRLRSAR
jgi:RNA polymerase sigma-70 factor (ECF subfamily)